METTTDQLSVLGCHHVRITKLAVIRTGVSQDTGPSDRAMPCHPLHTTEECLLLLLLMLCHTGQYYWWSHTLHTN